MIDQKPAWPVSASTASAPELIPSTDWVNSRMRRRGRRSASRPPPSERTTAGSPSAAATAATAVLLWVRSNTRKPSATTCIQVPSSVGHWAIQYQRKARTRERGRRPATQRRPGDGQRPHAPASRPRSTAPFQPAACALPSPVIMPSPQATSRRRRSDCGADRGTRFASPGDRRFPLRRYARRP